MRDPADDERVLVEMACGAALAAIYSGLIRRLQDEGKQAIRNGLLRKNDMHCFHLLHHILLVSTVKSFHATSRESLQITPKWHLRLVSYPGRLPAPLGPLLVIVCGGSSVDGQQLANLKVKLQT